MKTASMILGIIGGAFSVLGSLYNLFIRSIFSQITFPSVGPSQDFFDSFFVIFYVFAVIGVIGGLFGIAGGILVKKKRILAGIFLSIGAVTGFFGGLGFISGIMLILAAVFAFINEQPPAYRAKPPMHYNEMPPQPPQDNL